MNEAETRAEHIDPALKLPVASSKAVASGASIRSRRAGSKSRQTRQTTHRRLRSGVSQPEARRRRSQVLGRRVDRGCGAGQELRRQARRPLHLRTVAGHSRGASRKRQAAVFLDFVLQHYVSVGVEELDQEKLTPLLRLKYHDSIADAVNDLGRPDESVRCSLVSRSIYMRPPCER